MTVSNHGYSGAQLNKFIEREPGSITAYKSLIFYTPLKLLPHNLNNKALIKLFYEVI